jgi:hypothetical protein
MMPQNLNIQVPRSALEKARVGVFLLKEAILELARVNPDGVTNNEVAKALELESDYRGGSINYLSYSVLGLLLKEGRIKRIESTKRHVIED